jgi:hypothetical protein
LFLTPTGILQYFWKNWWKPRQTQTRSRSSF